MRITNLFVGICAAMPIVAGPAAAANLITNGSFEAPPLPSVTYQNHAVGSSTLTGWTIVGPANEAISQVRSDFAGNPGYTFPAEDGDIWLDLAGFVSNSATGISQTIATTIGTSYDLSFWVGNITGTFFGTQTQVGVEFSSGGTDFSCTNTAPGFVMDWKLCTYSFTAAAASTTLTFRNLDPTSDYSAAIDNIVLAESAPNAVPEPGSWALMIAGFAMLGGAVRTVKRVRPAGAPALSAG